MRKVKLTSYGSLSGIICPILSYPEQGGSGIDYVLCDSNCAWYNIKSVTDNGELGAFCGNKFIGNIERESE